MINNNTPFISCEASYDDANLVIFGAPYDKTASFKKGTRFAPATIRQDSDGIETYSPYQDKDLENIKVFDAGDLPICELDPVIMIKKVQEFTAKVLADGKTPIMLGGEHLVTLGAAHAIVNQYPDIYFLHFDAHTDLRNDYLGEMLSHATVMRRVWELVGDRRIFQFGIRSGERHEFAFAEAHTYMNKFNCDNIDSVISHLKGKDVYVTIDLDILDPSIFSGTGTPEAGGITFSELLSCVLKLADLNIVGADLNELSPEHDKSGVSTAVACKILRELLLVI